MSGTQPDSLDDVDTSLLDELGETFNLLMDAKNGCLSLDPQTYRFRFNGDTRAEALGKAYVIRDAIQDAGRQSEATYDEPADAPDWYDEQLHWIEIAVGEAASE